MLEHQTACVDCGAPVTRAIVTQTFPYGVDRCVMLHATVPEYTCSTCGMQYTDFEGEEIRHAAVLRYEATGETGAPLVRDE